MGRPVHHASGTRAVHVFDDSFEHEVIHEGDSACCTHPPPPHPMLMPDSAQCPRA